MDRAAIGLSAVFLRLQAKVNWDRLFEELIAGFDVAALERQTEALARHQSRCRGERPNAGGNQLHQQIDAPSLASMRWMVGSDKAASVASAR